MITNLVFIALILTAGVLFYLKTKKISRNINLGMPVDLSGNSKQRWKTMCNVALGQSKMVVRPVAGFLHMLVYVGFVIINIEVLEIILDGVFGTHRILSFLGPLYELLIASFEILALLVLLACVVFLIRRNVMRIARFHSSEMKVWPKSDANIILFTEIALMSAFLLMNATDMMLMNSNESSLTSAGVPVKYALSQVGETAFPISKWLTSILPASHGSLYIIERGCWWFHIIGILAFLNYLPYSKHFHIILAFPNTFYSKLLPKTQLTNNAAVKKEVELMMDPNQDPYATPADSTGIAEVVKFGAKDVMDLSWKQLMDAYTCTECGRCTSVCPANLTGKLLSPRKIMMDTRDRLDNVGKNVDINGEFKEDGETLLHNFISPEELWACTTCNACTEACPVNIDPVSIIVDLRRHLVMEESKGPTEFNLMYSNIENNGAPWQFAQADRLNWSSE